MSGKTGVVRVTNDRTTLYITSGTPSGGGNTGIFGLYSIHLNVPGWPY